MSISCDGSAESTCKMVPQSVMFKIRGSDKSYEEALEASVKFNKRLCRERKHRLPFIDSQTRVAQTNSMFWLGEYQRSKPIEPGNVYKYPIKKWYKNRRLGFDPNDSSFIFHRHYYHQTSNQQMENGNGMNGSSFHSNLNGNLLNENSNSMDSFHYTSSSSNHMQSQSVSNQMYKQASNSNDDYGIGNSNDEWSQQHNHNHQQQINSLHMPMHEDFDNFDLNNDNDDSGGDDDFDDAKKKKGKKGKPGRKKGVEINPEDKPYSCEKCGVKYKTRPGLNYHVQKCHLNPGSQPHSSHSKANKHHQHEPVINPDENTTNSVFDSVNDDTSSSLPHMANNNNSHQAVSFGSNQQAYSHQQNGSNANNQNNYNSFSSNNNNIKNSLNKCGLCGLSTDAYDVSGKPNSSQADKYVACSECLKSFHPACLKFNANMMQSVKKYSWLCVDCKKCVICGNSENDDKLLFCDDCDRGYHMYCLKPPMSEAPAGDWRCELCVKHLGNQ